MKLTTLVLASLSLFLFAGCNQQNRENMTLIPKKNDKTGKWGYINETGKKIISFKYEDARNFQEGMASVKQNRAYGYINKNGNMVVPLKYDYASDFSEELARIKINGKYGFIDKNGNEVIQAIHVEACDFLDGLAVVAKSFNNFNGTKYLKYGCIDKSGTLVTPINMMPSFHFQMEWQKYKLKKVVTVVTALLTQPGKK